MSEREWKPGDVAWFDLSDQPVLMMRGLDGRWTGYANQTDYWVDRPYDGLHNQRPAVAVDPESRVDFERIADMYDPTDLDECWNGRDLFISDLQEAFRRLVREQEKPPRPDEPGIGGLVRDRSGVEWVHANVSKAPWHSMDGRGRWAWWSDLDVPDKRHVMAEGITP